jgi:hypothetical protein
MMNLSRSESNSKSIGEEDSKGDLQSFSLHSLSTAAVSLASGGSVDCLLRLGALIIWLPWKECG